MFVVKSGIVEITVKIEGFNMAVERLYRGSVFNHKSFLLADLTATTALCTQSMTLFYLTSEQMRKLSTKNAMLFQQIQLIKQQASNNKKNPFIIDYIMCKSVLDTSNQRPSFIEERRSKLTCQLKNAVLIHLMALKAQKSKLTFKEVIA